MRTSFLLCALVLLPITLFAIEPEDSILKLVGKDWTITKDGTSLTITRQKIRMISLINPPPVEYEELWRDFSNQSDLRITINFSTKLTNEEYQKLKQVRKQLIVNRVKDLNPMSIEYYSAQSEAESILELPQYYTDRHSITFYSSGGRSVEFRPADVQQTLENIRKTLDKICQKYEQPVK